MWHNNLGRCVQVGVIERARLPILEGSIQVLHFLFLPIADRPPPPTHIWDVVFPFSANPSQTYYSPRHCPLTPDWSSFSLLWYLLPLLWATVPSSFVLSGNAPSQRVSTSTHRPINRISLSSTAFFSASNYQHSQLQFWNDSDGILPLTVESHPTQSTPFPTLHLVPYQSDKCCVLSATNSPPSY